MSEFVKLPKIQTLIPEIGELESLTDNLFIDFSSIAMQTLGSVNSANYVANEKKSGRTPTNDVMDEWYYQMAKKMIILAGATNPKNITIAVDSRPYWRNDFVADYYRKTNSYFWNPYLEPASGYKEGTWITEREGTLIKCEYDPNVEEWVFSNVKVADKKELGFEPNNGQWLEFKNGVMTDEAQELAMGIWGQAVPSNVYEYAPFTTLGLFECDKISYPYKHGRKWGYTSIIEKGEFVEKSTLFASMVAPFLGAYWPVSVEKAEADDVIHSGCKQSAERGETSMLASVDSDLRQLKHFYGTEFINLHDGINLVETTDVKEQANLTRKILGGDTSDKIRGSRKKTIRKKDGVVIKVSNPMSSDAADKWESQFRYTLDESITSLIDEESYNKNVALVDLTKAPADLQEAIETSLSASELALGAVITVSGKSRNACLEDIRVGMQEALIIGSEAIQHNVIWKGILDGTDPVQQVVQTVEAEPTETPVEDVVAPVVAPPAGLPTNAVVETPKPKLFRFVGHVASYALDPEKYPAWDTTQIVAENPGDFIEKLKDSDPAGIGAYVVENEDGIGWSWWVCPITIEDLGCV